MIDETYFIYTARKLKETTSTEDKPPKELIKRVRETKSTIIARMLWENRKNLTEGTRKFVQPEDLIDRSTKPDTNMTSKKSSKYPNPHEEPEHKADFPHRNEGAENPELLLHETFPFGAKEGYSLGPSGATTTAEGFGDMGMGGDQPDPLNPQQPQMGMPSIEPEPDTGLGSGLGPVGPEGLDSLWEPIQPVPQVGMDPLQDPNMMGQPQSPPEGQNLNEPHVCPVCNEPHNDEPSLDHHLGEAHHVYEKVWPFRQREGMPSATFPYGA